MEYFRIPAGPYVPWWAQEKGEGEEFTWLPPSDGEEVEPWDLDPEALAASPFADAKEMLVAERDREDAAEQVMRQHTIVLTLHWLIQDCANFWARPCEW